MSERTPDMRVYVDGVEYGALQVHHVEYSTPPLHRRERDLVGQPLGFRVEFDLEPDELEGT